MKKYKIFLSIFIAYIILNMVIYPSFYISKTLEGISVWTFNVLPSVLPFIFFTKILSLTGVVEKASKLFSKPCKVLFKTPSISSYVFCMSIISGYPVGAKVISDLYLDNKITRSDAFKMISFCSTSGPMFIIGTVGCILLKNATFGYIIFISHVLGALLNGLLYRNIKTDNSFSSPIMKKERETSLSDIIYDTLISVLSIGVVITIFFVVISSLSPFFNLFSPKLASILEGVIEITKGCIDISSSFGNVGKVLACSFVIGFGGISTILQSLAMLSKIKLPISLFVLQKFTHALISTVISFLICLII